MTTLALVPASISTAAEPSVTVLIYHEIVTDDAVPGETVIPLASFVAQMRWLHQNRYTVLDLDGLSAVVRGERRAPRRAVVITIDDGWKSGLNALPILEEYKFPASFWIIAGERGIGEPYLTWEQIEMIDRHPLFEVQSHTMSHPWDRKSNLVTWVENKVPGRSIDDARLELTESKRLLESRLGHPITALAWPCGWYNDDLVQMAKDAGYSMVMTAQEGKNGPGSSMLAIRRTFVDGACDLATFAKTVRTGGYRVCATSGRPTLGHLPPASASDD